MYTKWANVKEDEAVAAIATKEHAVVAVEVEGEEREELDGMQEVLGQLLKRQVHRWNPTIKCKK